MAKYRVKTKSFIGNTVVEEGAVVDYEGLPGDNLEAIDEEAEQATLAAEGVDALSLERQQAAARGVDPGPVETEVPLV